MTSPPTGEGAGAIIAIFVALAVIALVAALTAPIWTLWR